jgi:hypothetical protein
MGAHPGVERSVELRFCGTALPTKTHVNLSAVRADGPCLWVAGDETATVERLTADDPNTPEVFVDQLSFALADLVDLPGGPDEEADIEGLARSGGYLWAVGSHGLVRKRVNPEHADDKAIRRLARIEDQPNRRILARLAVEAGNDGLPRLVRRAADGRTSALLGAAGDQTLTRLLADDQHLGRFLAVPAKDNGFDVEGLAVHGERVYLGLRGPVLRGWAVVLELRPRADDATTRLELRQVDGKARYRKHFLDLDGLGVRDLCPHGEDLLVLAGPTMDLDGPVRVYRWHGAATADTSSVVRQDELRAVLDLPYGDGDDHAEGITVFGPADRPRLLVVYDSPAAGRELAGGVILADVAPVLG